MTTESKEQEPTGLDGLVTLTGESLIGALNALDTALPKGAYKPVQLGGRKFTDISPAYTTEEIANHFGPIGIGWGYTIEDEHVSPHIRVTDDKEYPYVGVTLRVALWFDYIDGAERKRVEWQTYGGNANNASGPEEHFCWQGALTNAIGKGWSLQGFQRTIYKGEDFGMEDAPSGPPASRRGTKGAGEVSGDWTMPFGKYKGMTLAAIQAKDHPYLAWIHENFGFKDDGTEDPKYADANAIVRSEALELYEEAMQDVLAEIQETRNAEGQLVDADGVPFLEG